jgi:hypothetical protein
MVGFDSLMNYINMPDCLEPAIVARALMRNDPTNQGMSLDDSNKLILAAIGTIHKWRRDPHAKDSDNDRTMNTATGQLTQSFELTSQHPDLTSVTPFRNGRHDSATTRAVTRDTEHKDVRCDSTSEC